MWVIHQIWGGKQRRYLLVRSHINSINLMRRPLNEKCTVGLMVGKSEWYKFIWFNNIIKPYRTFTGICKSIELNWLTSRIIKGMNHWRSASWEVNRIKSAKSREQRLRKSLKDNKKRNVSRETCYPLMLLFYMKLQIIQDIYTLICTVQKCTVLD